MGKVIYTDEPSDSLKGCIDELDADKVFVLTDRNVEEKTGIDVEKFAPGAQKILIEPGEESKDLRTASHIWSELGTGGATRRSVLVNVGGGVVSDLGGFAASVFKRGIRFINVPTTVLAAADAAIGGKTGIDYMGLKNEIGTFAMPEKVIVSREWFSTLGRNEILSGFGEIVKMALLTAPDLYRELLDKDALADEDLFGRALRYASVAKEEIVEKDPTEKGLRRILNLGHTAGHAFEMIAAEKGQPITHGEAVAHGIYYALRISEKYCGLAPEVAAEYKERILERYYNSLSLSGDDMASLLEKMSHDKKNRNDGRISFVLISAPGHPLEAVELEPTLLPDFLE